MSTDAVLDLSDRAHARSLLSDFVNTYYKVLSNPINVVLFFISVVEFALIISEKQTSVWSYIYSSAVNAAGTSPPDVIVTLLSFLKTIVDTLNLYRLFIALFAHVNITVVENQRDYITAAVACLIIYVMTFQHPLQMFFYAIVWVQFSNLSYSHRVVILLASVLLIYYDILDLKKDSKLAKAIGGLLPKTIK